LTADAAAGATALTVASITGISTTDRLGIQLDSGIMQWTTVNGAPSGSTVTAAVALATAAASGNRIFTYPAAAASQGRRPLTILAAEMRNSSGIDVPMLPMTLQEYEALSSKAANGTPQRYYYEDTLTDGTIYLDAAPTDITQIIRIVYLSPIEDFDASSDTPDYDQNWYLPLVLGLEEQCAMMFGKGDMIPAIRALLYGNDKTMGALTIARNATPEVSRAFYQPDAPT